jgi:hypothetical protein
MEPTNRAVTRCQALGYAASVEVQDVEGRPHALSHGTVIPGVLLLLLHPWDRTTVADCSLARLSSRSSCFPSTICRR